MRPRSPHADQQSVYGVLVGQVKAGHEDPPGPTPHYEIWIAGAGNWRVAVNVLSSPGSDVAAYFDADYTPPTGLDLAALADAPGFKILSTGPDGQGLDYVRGGLFPLDKMAPIPPTGSGVTLSSLLDAQVKRAMADAGAVAIVFGNRFQDTGADSIFGFSPAQGVHDIHLMQGDPPGPYASEDREHGDGALFFRFTGGDTTALFIRFATQTV